MVKLDFLNKGSEGESCEVVVETTHVGRGMDNDLVILDRSVSTHHCDLLVHRGEVIVRNQSSRNGTFVDGRKVNGQSPIKSGQVLRFGEVEVRVTISLSLDEFSDPSDLSAVSFTSAKARRVENEAQVAKSKPPKRVVGRASGSEDSKTPLLPGRREDQLEDHEDLPGSASETVRCSEARSGSGGREWLILGAIVVLLLILLGVIWWRG